jgi:hypothetical protein
MGIPSMSIPSPEVKPNLGKQRARMAAKKAKQYKEGKNYAREKE